MSPPPPLLSLKQVGKTYPAPPRGGLQVLDSICLDVYPRETLAIVGPAGSGKSTLLNIISTLEPPSCGQILFDGLNLNFLSLQDRAKIRNDKIGMIFPAHPLLKQCHVLENVLLPALVSRSAAGAEARARYLVEMAGLTKHLSHRPDQLSAGEQLRVVIARALINAPRLLLADEPTAALDPSEAEPLTELLLKMIKIEGTTLIMTSPLPDRAHGLDKAYHLINGRLEAQHP